MEGSRLLRSLLALLAVAAFTACGGGGGSSSVPSSGSGTNGSNGSGAETTQAKEQSAANSALSVTGGSLDVDQFGSTSSITSFAIARAIDAHNASRVAGATPAPSSSPSCQNGVEFSQSGSNGTYTETIEFFYDSQCTQPRKLVTMTITFGSGTGTMSGTETFYNMSGAVVYYKTDNATFTLSSNDQQLAEISMERTVAAGPSATPFAENGFTCVFSGTNSTYCGDGVVATVNYPKIYPSMTPAPSPSASASPGTSPSPSASPSPTPTPFEIGFTGTVTSTATTPSPSPSASASPGAQFGWNPQPVQLQFQIAGTGYTGATQSMTIASPAPGVTPPAWMLSGGTQVTTLSGNASLGFQANGMFSNSVDITLTDSADGLTITFTSSGQWGGLQGTVTNSSGATVATANVDANGDGVIYYTSGGMAMIRDWVILST